MRLGQIGFVLKRIVPQGEQGVTWNKQIALPCLFLTDVDVTCFMYGTHVPFPPHPHHFLVSRLIKIN